MERHAQALAILREGTVIPAIPLALDAEGRFSEQWQRLLVRYYLASGAGGIAVAVHTTQFAIRAPEHALFEPVLRVVSDEIGRYEAEASRTVIKVAGVCGPISQALVEAELAKRYAYDAVLLSPSGLSDLQEHALLERTHAVTKVLPVIGFYLQPAAGGRVFSVSYWQALCEIDNIVAIKCASFNRYSTAEVVRAAAMSTRAEEITLYTGNDDNIVIDLLTEYRFTQNGCVYTKRFQGGLLGHWAVFTQKAVRLVACLKDHTAKAQFPSEYLTLAAEITDMNAAVFDAANGFAGCIPGIHEILHRQGLMQGVRCLDSKETLSPGQKEEIDRVCAMYPHLTDDAYVRQHLAAWKEAVGLNA